VQRMKADEIDVGGIHQLARIIHESHRR
jgi:hypothetical protein